LFLACVVGGDRCACIPGGDVVAKWISVDERLPDESVPVMVWGTKLDSNDYPLAAELCSCHSRWITEYGDYETNDVPNALVERLVGTVTHWLDWSPPPVNDEVLAWVRELSNEERAVVQRSLDRHRKQADDRLSSQLFDEWTGQLK